jgi:ribosomal protein S8
MLVNQVYGLNVGVKAGTSGLCLSSNVGQVTDVYRGTDTRKVYCIQDLHCDEGVQTNIYKILEELKKEHGKRLKFVGLEGTPRGEINTSLLKNIPDKEVKNKVIEYLYSEGYLSGAELYDVKNNDIKVIGTEDYVLYKRNFLDFYETLKYRGKIEDIIGIIEERIGRVGRYVYSEELKGFLAGVERFSRGRAKPG